MVEANEFENASTIVIENQTCGENDGQSEENYIDACTNYKKL